jgi:hypothetical protein
MKKDVLRQFPRGLPCDLGKTWRLSGAQGIAHKAPHLDAECLFVQRAGSIPDCASI